jgi:hypothetical protein
MHKLKS